MNKPRPTEYLPIDPPPVFEEEDPVAGRILADAYRTGRIVRRPGWHVGQTPLHHIRPFWRGVGRNDLCPCMSGKKFKKCCA